MYAIVFMTLSIWDYSTHIWLFALTSVNYILGTIYFLYAAINVTHWYQQSRCQTVEKRHVGHEAPELKTKPELPFRIRLHWFLYNLSLGSCTVVFLAFWIILAPKRKAGYSPSLHNFLVIDRHGINLGLMIIDFILNKIPIRLFHCFYTSLFLIMYLVYNAIYWSVTGVLIYGKILDYRSNLGMVIILALGGICIVIPLIQFTWFSLGILKHSKSKDIHDANGNVELRDVDV